MFAMVLGTALTTFAPGGEAHAAPMSPEVVKAIDEMGRYCSVCWRNARLPESSWDDCTQDVFQRMTERVRREAWPKVFEREGDERREFHRAIDAAKKRVQRARRPSATSEGLADPRTLKSSRLAEDREAVDQAAEEVLTDRQQQILRMSLEGWTVAEISEEMDLPSERVSDEKYKAVRRLRKHLQVG